jgi:glycosyltransferase involved in cell wall biosynthesis
MSLLPRKISFVILTKNEEKNIKRALESIKNVADEILVVDSGSTDKTIDIAKSYGANVIFNEWVNYPSQVNFGISKAKNDIVFVLDADEELSSELKASLKDFLASDYEIGLVTRRSFYMGDFLKHVWNNEKLIRVFKKDVCKYTGELHEVISCKHHKVYKLKGYLNHYSFKSLKDQFERTLKYAKISADVMCKNNKPFHFYNLIINPIWIFFKFFILKSGYKEGVKGFIIAFSGMFYVFMKYAFLYECHKSKEKELWK